MPKAGERFEDGTLRLTDETSGVLCTHYLPWRDVFNADETLLLLFMDWVTHVYKVDAQGIPRPYKKLSDLTVRKLDAMSACWDPAVPGVLYVLEKAPTGQPRTQNLLTVNVETGAVVARPFTGLSPFDLAELSISENGKVFAFRAVLPSGSSIPVVWDVTTGNVIEAPASLQGNIHSVEISKDAQWLQVVTTYPNATWNYWEIGTDNIVQIAEGNAKDTGIVQHPFMGRLGLSCGNAMDNSVGLRRWETLGAAFEHLRQIPFTSAYHISGRKVQGAEWSLIVSTYGPDTEPTANKLYEVCFDGTTRLLGDTRSTSDSFVRDKYWWQPRAHCSRSGKYVAWTSGLGSSTRTDVLMMTMPEADVVIRLRLQVSGLQQRVTDDGDDISDLHGDVGLLEDTVSGLNSEIAAASAWRDRVREAVNG